MNNSNHYDLTIVQPSFNSSLTDLIIELDYLRKKTLKGTTHPQVFFQLKVPDINSRVLRQLRDKKNDSSRNYGWKKIYYKFYQ